MDPVSIYTVLAALIPTGNYVIKRFVDYYTGGKEPVNSKEYSESRKADAEVLQALADLDGQQETYKWVAAIRQLQRPIAVTLILSNWTILTVAGLFGLNVDLQIYVVTANLASAAVFYLFGDRTLMYSLSTLNKKLFNR